MISKILVVAVLCVACVLAEAPINRYRPQRFRQGPRQFFARQEAPYPESQGGEPKPEYGPPKPVYGPPTTTPSPQYGAPPSDADPEITNAEPTNPDAELVAGQPSRLTQFGQHLPTRKSPPKFSQRLELKQQVHQLPSTQVVTPFQQVVTPVQHVVSPVQQQVLSPVQLAALQQAGSYYIELPNGSIQRVNYLSEPSLLDETVYAKLQFRPVAEVQTTVAEPQLFVNTVVQSHVATDDSFEEL